MDYETEEQQVEALKAWWAENGKAVMAGAGLGAAASGGWGWWSTHQTQQAVAASEEFSRTLAALQGTEPTRVQSLAERLREDHDGTLYAAYGALAAARIAVQNGQLEEAAKELEWVSKNAEQQDVKLIAAIRLARVLGASEQAERGLDQLPDSYPDAFTGLIEEARGDLLLATGDQAGARAAYEKAKGSRHVVDPESLGMKLDELAVAGDES